MTHVAEANIIVKTDKRKLHSLHRDWVAIGNGNDAVLARLATMGVQPSPVLATATRVDALCEYLVGDVGVEEGEFVGSVRRAEVEVLFQKILSARLSTIEEQAKKQIEENARQEREKTLLQGLEATVVPPPPGG